MPSAGHPDTMYVSISRKHGLRPGACKAGEEVSREDIQC